MWWYGRGNSGGSWLLEEKKANMWPGRENSSGSRPPAFPRSCSAHRVRFTEIQAVLHLEIFDEQEKVPL